MTREEMLKELRARAVRGKAIKAECEASTSLDDPCWTALRVNTERADWLRHQLYGDAPHLPRAGAA